MIDLGDFKPVTLGDRRVFEDHYLRFPQTHSENMFTTLVSWAAYTPSHYLLCGDSLVLMQLKCGKPQMRLPIGAYDASLISEVMLLAKASGGDRPLAAVDEAAKDRLEAAFPGVRMTPDRDYFDYVYSASDLAELPGKQYQTHRNHLNKFRRLYRYQVEEISGGGAGELDEFINRWCRQSGCETDPLLAAEVEALRYCIRNFRALGLSGITLRIDGGIQALSVYEPLNESTAAIHFEKAMSDYEGVYAAVNNEAATILAKNYKYINRESDLGIPGLRTAKQRLNPHHMEKIYYLDRDAIPQILAASPPSRRH